MKNHIQKIPAGEFKAKCLSILDEVEHHHIAIVITKRGRPVAKLIPLETEKATPIYGYMKGSVTIKGDIISPLDEKWEADE